MRKQIKAFVKELLDKARQNDEDFKLDGDRHGKGFADCQRWAARRLKEILQKA